ncbi:TetR/AcrR family transcriptional regulator [Fusobacteria bacterium ZRK30]|nr:TetR/AcrR family transcriptional regulator [Fusobacteria bacterium ZRK30]
MKKKTKQKIIDSAIDLFSKDSYGKVSIAQICKNAKISNGIIYNYFRNKEELFTYLLEETSNRIEEQFKNIEGKDLQARMENFILLNFDITKKEFPLIRVYREGQYKFIEYEQKLRNVYLEALKVVYGRELKELEYLFIMSGIRYINVNFVKRGLEIDEKFLAQILLHGFFNESDLEVETFEDMDFYLRVLFNSGNKKHKLLEVGEKLFGETNYYKVTINDIAGEAQIGVGSFYHFYENKEIFLREIVENLKRTTLYFLKDNVQNNFSQNETHILFLYLLLEFYGRSPHKYELLRRSEFIAEDMVVDYNHSLDELYIKTMEGLSYNFEEKRIISSVLLGVAHYMGIEFFFTNNIKDKGEFLKEMKGYFANGLAK